MKITLNYDSGKYPVGNRNAGRGSVDGFLQIFVAPASRPAGVFAGIWWGKLRIAEAVGGGLRCGIISLYNECIDSNAKLTGAFYGIGKDHP